jgi:hypothetical protein
MVLNITFFVFFPQNKTFTNFYSGLMRQDMQHCSKVKFTKNRRNQYLESPLT